MKRLKFPAFLLVMAIAVVSAFAFNTPTVKSHHFDATYYYVGDNTLAQMQDKDNWVTTGTACGSSGDRPCTYNWVGTRVAFNAHVAGFPSTAQAISESATIKF